MTHVRQALKKTSHLSVAETWGGDERNGDAEETGGRRVVKWRGIPPLNVKKRCLYPKRIDEYIFTQTHIPEHTSAL